MYLSKSRITEAHALKEVLGALPDGAVGKLLWRALMTSSDLSHTIMGVQEAAFAMPVALGQINPNTAFGDEY